jgi:MFS family permease
VRCVSQATVAVLLLSGTAELWHLIVLEAVYGSAAAFFEPAATGLVPATVNPSRLQEANALFGLSRGAGFVAGPALAGVIVAVANPGIAFAIDAGSFLVSSASLALLRVPRVARGERKTFLSDLAAGWREFVSRTWLWVIIVWAATYLLLVLAPFQVLGPLVAKESLGGPKAWGFILAAYSGGALLGGLLALRWKPARPLVACCLLTFVEAIPPALLALREPTAAIASAQVAAGLVMGFFMAVWTTTLQQEIPERSLSRVSSYDWLGSLAFLPLGYALAGPVAAAIGVSTTLWISSGWVVLSTAGVLLVPGVWALRRREVRSAGLQLEGEAV